MRDLDPDQRERLRELRAERHDRIERRCGDLDAGRITGHRIAVAKRGIADDQRVLGIIAVQEGDVADARAQFGTAATSYVAAIEATLEQDPWATIFKQSPEICQDGLVTAMLAGDVAQLEQLVSVTRELPAPGTHADGGVHPGQYHLAQTLADVAEGTVTESNYQNAIEWFADAPDALSHYVDGITGVAGGLAEDDADQVADAIEELVAYHEADRHPDNVVDAVLAPAATGVTCLAHHHGYEVMVASEFVPAALVRA